MCAASNLATLWPAFWMPGDGQSDVSSFRCAREIEFHTRRRTPALLGISVSPLRTGDQLDSGYVINFQDLTELKRLEQEVATKERMAALGRFPPPSRMKFASRSRPWLAR